MKRRQRTAAINIATIATHEIIAAESGLQIKITSIFFTVGGEVNITLYDGAAAVTGAMDFGGTSEPRGMVVALGQCPIELRTGSAFNIAIDAAIQVSGNVTYYLEKA